MGTNVFSMCEHVRFCLEKRTMTFVVRKIIRLKRFAAVQRERERNMPNGSRKKEYINWHGEDEKNIDVSDAYTTFFFAVCAYVCVRMCMVCMCVSMYVLCLSSKHVCIPFLNLQSSLDELIYEFKHIYYIRLYMHTHQISPAFVRSICVYIVNEKYTLRMFFVCLIK